MHACTDASEGGYGPVKSYIEQSDKKRQGIRRLLQHYTAEVTRRQLRQGFRVVERLNKNGQLVIQEYSGAMKNPESVTIDENSNPSIEVTGVVGGGCKSLTEAAGKALGVMEESEDVETGIQQTGTRRCQKQEQR